MPGKQTISPEMTILEIVHSFPGTQAVFVSYDSLEGRCILCEHLFETLGWLIASYGLDREKFFRELSRAADDDSQVSGWNGKC